MKVWLSLLLFFLTTCFQQELHAQCRMGAKFIGLKGDVQTVTTGWLAETGERERILDLRKYDRKGNETEIILYATFPSIKSRVPNNKIVCAIKGSIKTERSYRLNQPSKKDIMPMIVGIMVNGKLEKLPSPPPQTPPKYEPDGAFLRQAIIKQNLDQNRIEEVWHKGGITSSPVSHTIEYLLDKDGRVIEDLFYSTSENKPSHSYFKFNEAGVQIEFTEFDRTEKLHIRDTFSLHELDAKGNWISRTATKFYVRKSDGQPVTFVEKQYRKITYHPPAK